MSFYLAIILFITAVITGLLLMLVKRELKRDQFIVFAGMHMVLFIGFISSLILKKDNSGYTPNYFLLIFICSGIALSGITWRSSVKFILRLYFLAFALTLPMFLFSPSMLVNFLLTGKYTDSIGPSFKVDDKIFIQYQGTVMKNDEHPHYKVILKKGMFHQTLQRDLVFNGHLDSIRVLEIEKGEKALIRGFSSKTTYVTDDIDSSDVEIVLKKPLKANEVEYKL